MKKVVLASNNSKKLKEIGQILCAENYELISQKSLNIASPEETGLTFIENAILKARHVSEISGLPAIADDSGLQVDCLNGAPGIYSSRYAGESASDQDNVDQLLLNLKNIPCEKRTASFYCAIVLLRHFEDPTPIIALGQWYGEILETPHGQNGFGYDPIFYVPTHQCSAAELDAKEKNKISHRAQALKNLIEQI